MTGGVREPSIAVRQGPVLDHAAKQRVATPRPVAKLPHCSTALDWCSEAARDAGVGRGPGGAAAVLRGVLGRRRCRLRARRVACDPCPARVFSGPPSAVDGQTEREVIMRTVFIVLATAVALLLGPIGLAQPMAAAPAEPFREAACTPVGSGDEEIEFCYETYGVTKENETPSGNTQYHVSEQFCSTIIVVATGEVLDETCNDLNLVEHVRDGESQVDHTNQTIETTFMLGGTRYECTTRFNVTFANGELRHENFRSECIPPL